MFYLVMFQSGGYDRGECLDTVSVYDPAANEWRPADKMLTKRGRFDATVIQGCQMAIGRFLDCMCLALRA